MLTEKDEKIDLLNSRIDSLVDTWGFRGISKSEKIISVKKWLHNFEVSEISVIFNLLPKINLQRDIDIQECLKIVSACIRKIFGTNLYKVKFFASGDSSASSGSQYLYHLKAHLGLTEAHFPNTWDLFDHNSTYVFIDDFIGSGNQASEFFNAHPELKMHNCYYFSLFGYQQGIDHIKLNTGFKFVFAARILSQSDKIFSDDSTFEEKEACKQIAQKWGLKLYPKHPLGYENSQSAICFLEGCPNNTLPIFWAGPLNESEPMPWYPLFERKKIKNKPVAKIIQKFLKNPVKLIKGYYERISAGQFETAFDCLSPKLRAKKYFNNIKYFAGKFRNTNDIGNLLIIELQRQPQESNLLVHFDENTTVLEHNNISILSRMGLKDAAKIKAELDAFRDTMINQLNVNEQALDVIPLANFFSEGALEDFFAGCDMPQDKIARIFKSKRAKILRPNYTVCKKIGVRWYIDKITPLIHLEGDFY